jgi:hypothetical protein
MHATVRCASDGAMVLTMRRFERSHGAPMLNALTSHVGRTSHDSHPSHHRTGDSPYVNRKLFRRTIGRVEA